MAPQQDGDDVQMSSKSELTGCCYKKLGIFEFKVALDDPTIYIFQPLCGGFLLNAKDLN